MLEETGLLPHTNPGVLTRDELALLRTVSVSQGLMLETASERLSRRGGPHFGSPDKLPAARLETIGLAGELRIPFTTGILIGIGETREERIDALLAIRELHERYGHVQEVIVQNFRAKPGTKMADHPEPSLDELLWSAAAARVLLPADVHVQCPPNLSGDDFGRLLEAGIDDWGGVSPVTIDHVNPEAPWPELERLARETEARGFTLVPRLAVYPEYVSGSWIDPGVMTRVLHASDGEGFARDDSWAAGTHLSIPFTPRNALPIDTRDELDEDAIVRLFAARGEELSGSSRRPTRCGARSAATPSPTSSRETSTTRTSATSAAASAPSRKAAWQRICAASPTSSRSTRSSAAGARRGSAARSRSASRAASIPGFTGETYLEICRALKAELPDLHIHAFSALEVWQGAATLGLPLEDYLSALRDAGLASLPGTAAEVLDDEVRRVICPDKVTTAQWLRVHDVAHRVGLRSTTTVMFGHVDGPRNWARHLLELRDQQRRSGGFTEFVPLPFVHMEAPIYLKGNARPGPTFREAVLMHAVARLALHPWITNIQASWVKLGIEGAQAVLRAGANDLGGTLMNESISRAAGADHGQEMPPEGMEAAIRAIGRTPRQRTTLYGEPATEARRRLVRRRRRSRSRSIRRRARPVSFPRRSSCGRGCRRSAPSPARGLVEPDGP